MAERLALAKNKQYLAVSMAPSINYTPVGPSMVPVPYPVVADLSNAIEFVPNVLINGDPAVVHAQSSQPKCTGDEAGTGGGIISGTVSGECKPLHGSRTVRAAKKWLLRVGDLCSMQGGNTIGSYVAMPAPIPCPVAGEPEPDEDPPILAQTRREKAFLERREAAPPAPEPPPPPTPLRGWQEHLDAFQKLFPVEQFWPQVGLGEFKEALNCGLRFMERGVQGLLAPLLGGIVKDQRKFFQLLDLFNFPRFPMKNPGQALGAKRLKGSTGSMVFESLMRGIPAFVSHPALEWGPKLWGCAKKILPKKVVKDLERKVQRVRAKVLEKLDGGKGVGAPQEPEPVDPAAGGSSIPRPGDGARILKRREVKVKDAGRPVASEGPGLAEGEGELFEVPPELQAELEERKANPLDQENPVDPGASVGATGQPEAGPEEVERDTVKAKPGSTITTLVGNDPKAVDAFKKVNGLGDSVIHPGREYKLPTAKEIAEGDRDEGLKQFARDNRRQAGEKVRKWEEAQARVNGPVERPRVESVDPSQVDQSQAHSKAPVREKFKNWRTGGGWNSDSDAEKVRIVRTVEGYDPSVPEHLRGPERYVDFNKAGEIVAIRDVRDIHDDSGRLVGRVGRFRPSGTAIRGPRTFQPNRNLNPIAPGGGKSRSKRPDPLP